MPSGIDDMIDAAVAEVESSAAAGVRHAAETFAGMLRSAIHTVSGETASRITVKDTSRNNRPEFTVDVGWPWKANEFGYIWLPHSQNRRHRDWQKADKKGRVQTGTARYVPPKPIVRKTLASYRQTAVGIIAGGT